MNSKESFELAVTYDEEALRAAGGMLFRRYWRARAPIFGGGIVGLLVCGGLLAYFRLYSMLWWVALLVVANFTTWPYIRWSIRRKLMKNAGKSAQIRLTAADFSTSSDGASLTLPWTRIKFAEEDEQNLYLFVGRTTAFIVPRRGTDPIAIQFARACVSDVPKPA